MKLKTNTRAGIVIAVLAAAMGVIPATATAKPKLWCPQQAGQPCERVGKFPDLEPARGQSKAARSTPQPLRANDRYGAEVWRAGSWLMF